MFFRYYDTILQTDLLEWNVFLRVLTWTATSNKKFRLISHRQKIAKSHNIQQSPYDHSLPVVRGVLLVVDLVALVEGVEEVVAVVNLPTRRRR